MMRHGRFYLWAVAHRWRAAAALYGLCVIAIAVGVGMAAMTLPSCHSIRDKWRQQRDADPSRSHGSPRDVS